MIGSFSLLQVHENFTRVNFAFVRQQLALQVAELSAVSEVDMPSPQNVGFRQHFINQSGGRARCDTPRTRTFTSGRYSLQRLQDWHFTTFGIDLQHVDFLDALSRKKFGCALPGGSARFRRSYEVLAHKDDSTLSFLP